MLCELHCHSIYSTGRRILSEGSDEPREIVRQAKKLGIGCLAITDHDNMDGVEKARKFCKKAGIVLVPGEEVTTKAGHTLALGIQEPVKPRMDLEETLDAIHRQGGLAIAAHPFDRRRYGMGELARKCDAIEVFNSLSLDRIPNLYALELACQKRMPMTAGSDAHSLKMMGKGLIEAEFHDADSCLKAIRKGRVQIKAEYTRTPIVVDWMIDRMRYSYYYTTNYMKMNYRQPKKFIAIKLMRLVKKDSKNLDYFFRLAGYFALGSLLTYSIAKNMAVNTAAKLHP
jgi:predicted metal-dependent phosphoesterase TrpH